MQKFIEFLFDMRIESIFLCIITSILCIVVAEKTNLIRVTYNKAIFIANLIVLFYISYVLSFSFVLPNIYKLIKGSFVIEIKGIKDYIIIYSVPLLVYFALVYTSLIKNSGGIISRVKFGVTTFFTAYYIITFALVRTYDNHPKLSLKVYNEIINILHL